MALGSFELIIDGDRLDGTTEDAATLSLTIQGRPVVVDSVAHKLRFPTVAGKGKLSISLPYSISLPTDVASGAGTLSGTIGYSLKVTTAYGGEISATFAAREAGATVYLDELPTSFVLSLDDAIRARDIALAAAAAAQAAAAAAASGGGSYVTAVAGRIGNVVLTKDDVDLSNADNTADADKPISHDVRAALDAGLADLAKSKAGVGGFIFIRDGIDTPTGDPKELVLIADTSSGVSGGNAYPPGLDVLGGQVGCTWADPGMMITPASTDTEASGNVLVAVAGNRVSSRFTMQDVVLDKVTWQIGEGSTANVSGTIGIAKPDGTILRQATVNLTPSSVTAGTGDTRVWTLTGAAGTLTAPLTDADLNVGDELVIFTQHASGTVRFFARGLANMVNPDTVSRVSGSLHRAGVLASAPVLASPLAFGSGYTKKPVPFFLFTRTI